MVLEIQMLVNLIGIIEVISFLDFVDNLKLILPQNPLHLLDCMIFSLVAVCVHATPAISTCTQGVFSIAFFKNAAAVIVPAALLYSNIFHICNFRFYHIHKVLS